MTLLVLVTVALSFIDEPLRAYAEREINHHLPAHSVRIGTLDLQPFELSLDLEHITMNQKDRPDRPIAAISKIRGRLQWRALLSGRHVTDQVIEHPVIHVIRPQAETALQESSQQKQSWQELLFAMY